MGSSPPLVLVALAERLVAEEVVLERLLVVAQMRRIVGVRHGEAGRQVGIEQAGALQLVQAGQILDRVEAEMLEELRGRAVGHRPTRRAAAAAQFDPARLQQHVDGAFRGAHPPDLLDLGAGDRLVIGDDGERLQRRARQAALLDRLLLQQEGQIVGGAERPFAGDAHQIDAARGIGALQLLEQRAHVLALDEMPGDGGFGQRLGGGEQQRLDDAQFLAPIGRLQRDDIGGERQRQARSLALRLVFRHIFRHCLHPTQLLRCHPWAPLCCSLVDHAHAARSRRRTNSGAKDFAWRISSAPSRVISKVAVKLEASAVLRSSGSTRNSAIN